MVEAKAVVVFSGGMDSTTLLCEIKARGYCVYGISFYYGQRHEKELEFASYWGERMCVAWRKVDISFMKEIADRSALIDKTLDMPRQHYTHKNQRITVVPNRNMVMLSIAIAWAENMKIGEVFFGPHANDYAIYPDCRREFVQALSQASILGTYSRVTIRAPFVGMQKHQIARLGDSLGIDFAKTWSCYQGGKKHCGSCATCQERKEAFAKSNIPDPTQYELGVSDLDSFPKPPFHA